MSREEFHSLINEAGGEVTLTQSGNSQTVVMASAGVFGDEAVKGDYDQDMEQVVISAVSFDAIDINEPLKSDQILDTDGFTEWVITNVKKMYGAGRVLYGYKCKVSA